MLWQESGLASRAENLLHLFQAMEERLSSVNESQNDELRTSWGLTRALKNVTRGP